MFLLLEELANQNEAIASELREFKRLKGTYPYRYEFTNYDYEKWADEVNGQAATTHGVTYLKATEAAIEAAEKFCLDVTRPQVRALLTTLVTAILDSQNKDK